MNYNKKTVHDFDPKGKKVLLRCDFNVPQNKETGEITSDKRIVAALPTIKYLLDNGAAVIACSHLGKPKGEWKEEPYPGPRGQAPVRAAGHGRHHGRRTSSARTPRPRPPPCSRASCMLLENLRFDKREEKNDPDFAKELASHGRRLRVRRFRHRPPRPRLHRRRRRLSCPPMPDCLVREGDLRHGQGP